MTKEQEARLLQCCAAILTGVRCVEPGQRPNKERPAIVDGENIMLLADIFREIVDPNGRIK